MPMQVHEGEQLKVVDSRKVMGYPDRPIPIEPLVVKPDATKMWGSSGTVSRRKELICVPKPSISH